MNLKPVSSASMAVFNDRRFRYPQSAEDPEVDVHTRDQFSRVHQLYGSGKIEGLFGEHDKSSAPWPMAARRKDRPSYDQSRVTAEILKEPPELHDYDPRNLHSTQPHLVRAGVEHYLNSAQFRGGQETFADQGNPGNRYPLVYEREGGENLLLAGHHRAAAALLKGKPLTARRVRGPWGEAR